MSGTISGDTPVRAARGHRPRQSEQQEAIDAFIRTRGVTRCPTACVGATQATIDAADREALRQRWAEAEARRLPGFRTSLYLAPSVSREAPPPAVRDYAGAKGRATLKAGADSFAASVLPIVESIRAAGVTGLSAIAEELNRRGIGAPRGGKWRGSAVRRLLARMTDR